MAFAPSLEDPAAAGALQGACEEAEEQASALGEDDLDGQTDEKRSCGVAGNGLSFDNVENASDVSSVTSAVSGSLPTSPSPSYAGPAERSNLDTAAAVYVQPTSQPPNRPTPFSPGENSSEEAACVAGVGESGGFAVPEPIQAPSQTHRPRGRGKRASRSLRGRILIPARAQWARMRAERAAAMAAAQAAQEAAAVSLGAASGDSSAGAQGAGGAPLRTGDPAGPSEGLQPDEQRTLAGGDLKRFGSLLLIPGKTRKWRKVRRRVGNARVQVWEEVSNSEDPLLQAVQAMLRHGIPSSSRRSVRHTRAVACHIKETTRQYLQQSSSTESANPVPRLSPPYSSLSSPAPPSAGLSFSASASAVDSAVSLSASSPSPHVSNPSLSAEVPPSLSPGVSSSPFSLSSVSSSLSPGSSVSLSSAGCCLPSVSARGL
ncbi:hypothetical protein TGPRC2_202480 [Toxoplasma gondii TgCatPRC2]|uniref:Uncharacterized protein n=1 Tax=Toxoplasma gondii TgCatPRC2 TaxID=1130821 RepID=A0A151HB11_TOXGO|nr:hypothetical protein TGPRC2_202480 [Toxoplasma gondii TgCatPRC2]